MSENKALQTVFDYRLNWKDLAGLAEVEATAILAVQYCENELNVLLRLSTLSMHWPDGERLDEAAFIQRNTLLRVMTGKLFEFMELYRKISTLGRDNEAIMDSLSETKELQRDCARHEGYKIAKKIRNSQAHHYDLDDIGALVKSHKLDSSCNLYFGQEHANSFFPFAERLVFNPDPSNRAESELSEVEAHAIINSWVEWSLKTVDLVRQFHRALFERIIVRRFPHRYAERKLLWIDVRLKVSLSEPLPLFLRGEP